MKQWWRWQHSMIEGKISLTEGSENEMNKNVRIRFNEYLFNRAYPFSKRLYIEGKEILLTGSSENETCTH